MFPQNVGSPGLGGPGVFNLPPLLRLTPRRCQLQLPGASGVGGVEASEAGAKLRRRPPPVAT